MDQEPASHRCPLCGAPCPAGLEACPACRADVAAPETSRGVPPRTPEEAPLQPAFELVWRASAGLPAASRAIRALRSAGETAAAFSLHPETSFRRFRVEGGLAGPLAFGTLIGGPCLLLDAAFRAWSEDGTRLEPPVALGILLLAPALYLYVRSQAVHLTMVLSGRARRSFTATFRVVGYANASAAPLLLVPLAGEVLFLVLGSILEVTGIRLVHRLRLADALVVELVPVSVLILVLAAAGLVGLLWWSQIRS